MKGFKIMVMGMDDELKYKKFIDET